MGQSTHKLGSPSPVTGKTDGEGRDSAVSPTIGSEGASREREVSSHGSLVSSEGSNVDEDIQRLLMLEKKRASLTPLGVSLAKFEKFNHY